MWSSKYTLTHLKSVSQRPKMKTWSWGLVLLLLLLSKQVLPLQQHQQQLHLPLHPHLLHLKKTPTWPLHQLLLQLLYKPNLPAIHEIISSSSSSNSPPLPLPLPFPLISPPRSAHEIHRKEWSDRSTTRSWFHWRVRALQEILLPLLSNCTLPVWKRRLDVYVCIGCV